jgi:predicted DNA-binding transcriptional regulator AlpA
VSCKRFSVTLASSPLSRHPYLVISSTDVLTFSALLTLLGRRSRQSIYDLMRRDPSFPLPRQIGSEFSIGWLRGEVMEWLNSRPKAELNGMDAVERRRRFSMAAAAAKPPDWV